MSAASGIAIYPHPIALFLAPSPSATQAHRKPSLTLANSLEIVPIAMNADVCCGLQYLVTKVYAIFVTKNTPSGFRLVVTHYPPIAPSPPPNPHTPTLTPNSSPPCTHISSMHEAVGVRRDPGGGEKHLLVFLLDLFSRPLALFSLSRR